MWPDVQTFNTTVTHAGSFGRSPEEWRIWHACIDLPISPAYTLATGTWTTFGHSCHNGILPSIASSYTTGMWSVHLSHLCLACRVPVNRQTSGFLIILASDMVSHAVSCRGMHPANELARKHPFILNCKLEPLRWAKLAVRGRLPVYTWTTVLADLKRNTGEQSS